MRVKMGLVKSWVDFFWCVCVCVFVSSRKRFNSGTTLSLLVAWSTVGPWHLGLPEDGTDINMFGTGNP